MLKWRTRQQMIDQAAKIFIDDFVHLKIDEEKLNAWFAENVKRHASFSTGNIKKTSIEKVKKNFWLDVERYARKNYFLIRSNKI